MGGQTPIFLHRELSTVVFGVNADFSLEIPNAKLFKLKEIIYEINKK